jgi:hypothetical protein
MALPRPTNRGRGEIQRLARAAIDLHGGPDLVRVFYKYDCAGCARRVRIAIPNALPRRARCGGCGTWTTIEGAGYLLQQRASTAVGWRMEGPGVLTARKQYDYVPEQAETIATEFDQ